MKYSKYRKTISKFKKGTVVFIKKDGSERTMIFDNKIGQQHLKGGTYSAAHIDTLMPVFEVTAEGDAVGWKSVSLDKIISLTI